jgi:hypothetical protein
MMKAHKLHFSLRRKLACASWRHERWGAIESGILDARGYFLAKLNEGR